MSQQSAAINSSPTKAAGGVRLPFDGFATRHQDALLLLGRIVLGVIFVNSGLHKLMALDGFAASLGSKAVPFATAFAPLGAGVEFFGGLAVILGVASRATGLLMVLFVIVATAISHRFWEFEGAIRVAQEINFDKNLCITGGFIMLFAAGAGRLSIDGLLRGGRTKGQ
jgi:putative oxidoreductase